MKEQGFMTVIGRLALRLCSMGGSISGILLMIIMGFIFYSVIARYFMKAPASWINEVVSFLLVPVAALALGDTQVHRRHVAVDLLVIHLPSRVRVVLGVITAVFMAVYALFIMWATAVLGLESWFEGLRSITARIPLGAVQLLLPIGFALLALQAVVDCFEGQEEKGENPRSSEAGADDRRP